MCRDVFPGNVIPASMLNPVSQNLLAYYPHANRPGDPRTGVK